MLLGEGGLADSMQPGQIVVDTSTISLRARRWRSPRRSSTVASPSSMRRSPAWKRARGTRTLTIMCGGERRDVRSGRALPRCMGNNILYMGGVGSGQLTKLINQLLFDINAAALAEILPMAVKMGLDPEKVGSVVNSGTGRSYASEFFIPRILQDNFADGYRDAQRLQGPGQRRRARRASRCIPDAGPGRRHRDLSDGPAAGARRQRQGRHDPCVRGSARRPVPQAAPSRAAYRWRPSRCHEAQGPRQRPDQLRRPRLRPLPAPLVRALDGHLAASC